MLLLKQTNAALSNRARFLLPALTHIRVIVRFAVGLLLPLSILQLLLVRLARRNVGVVHKRS